MVNHELSSRSFQLYAITPTLFARRGASVDHGAMAAITQWMVSEGISDFLLTGSYGEFQSLTDEERVTVLRAVRSVPGVRSVMACAALPSNTATASLAARLLGEGANTVMVAAPLAAEVSPADVLRHFEHLSQRLPGGLVIYNNPVFGRDLAPAELALIAALPGVTAVKQGTGSLPALVESVTAVHGASAGGVRLLVASDANGVPGLIAGADGLTSTNSWVFPQAMLSLVGAADRGDWEAARRVWAALGPYFAAVRRLGQPRAVKAAMRLRGLPGTEAIRLPYIPLDDSERSALLAVLEECDRALASICSGRYQPAGGS
jgi:dihydrodipicolinate synthase/N-acetylneuraminate lyase